MRATKETTAGRKYLELQREATRFSLFNPLRIPASPYVFSKTH